MNNEWINDPQIIDAAIRGLKDRMAEIEAEMEICRKRLNGEVYVLPSGQPCCPFHGSVYQDAVCAVCARLTGTEPVTQPTTRKPHVMSAAGRRSISRAQKKRWAVIHRREGKRR